MTAAAVWKLRLQSSVAVLSTTRSLRPAAQRRPAWSVRFAITTQTCWKSTQGRCLEHRWTWEMRRWTIFTEASTGSQRKTSRSIAAMCSHWPHHTSSGVHHNLQSSTRPHRHTYTYTRLTALCPGLPGWAGTRKVKPSGFYWSKRQWVAVASAGPYASLHLAPDR